MAEYGADSIKVLEGLEPTRKRPNIFVDENDMSNVIKFRAKIREMDYIPLTDEEVAEIARKDEKAIINHRLSGIHFTSAEQAFFTMLLEERVPSHISKEIVKEWVMSEIDSIED